MQAVEGIEDQRRAGFQRRLQGREIAAAIRDHLAVDQRRVAGQGQHRLAERPEAVGPVLAVAGVEPRAALADRGKAAVAVILGLVPPAVARGRRLAQGGKLHLAEAGQGLRVPARRQRRAAAGDLGHRPSGRDAGPVMLQEGVVILRRLVVALLDQKPVLAPLVAPAAAHPHQRPAAPHPRPVEAEMQLALLQPLRRIGKRLPPALIPEHDRAGAVIALGDDALEVAVAEGVILGPYRQPLLRRIEARPLRHRPAEERALPFEAEVIVQPGGVVLLHDEAQPFAARLRAAGAGFGRAVEIAHPAILVEPSHHAFFRLPAALGAGALLSFRLFFSASIRSTTFSPAWPLSSSRGVARGVFLDDRLAAMSSRSAMS